MKFPKPWFRKGRGWFVTLDGKQVKLGTKREAAFAEYQQLISQPAAKRPINASTVSLVDIVEHFLEWTQKNRAPDTYQWYRYRLERLCQKHPDIAAEQLKPFMVQQWIEGYELLRAFSLTTVVRKSTEKLRTVDQTEAGCGTGNWRLLYRFGDDIQAITEDESLERFGFRSSSCAFEWQGGDGEECRSGWK